MRAGLPLVVVALAVLGAGPAPRDAGHTTRVVSDVDGALQRLVIHFDPAAEEAVAPSYRDLLRAIATDVRVAVAVARPAHFARFRRLLRRWRVRRTQRFTAVVVGLPITTWARDRFVLARRGSQRLLLTRARPEADGSVARRNDWRVPFALARASGGRVRAQVWPLLFDGGDVLAADGRLLYTPLLLHRNRRGVLGDPGRLSRWLARRSGLRPLMLGQRVDQVPPHHIGMFVTPLGGRRVLVGDPDLGLRLLSPAAARRLPRAVERAPRFSRRFATIAAALRRAGYDVRPSPLVPLVDHVTYVTYNNALLERRGGRLHAYLPQFGLPVLDRAGRRAFAAEGVVVHPVDVRRVFRHGGTVRCLVNVLRRGRADRLPPATLVR